MTTLLTLLLTLALAATPRPAAESVLSSAEAALAAALSSRPSTAAPPVSGAAASHHYGPWRRVWAPWYGPGYYGHRTACGQILTKTLIGYASRTGKCGDLREFRWKGKTIIAPRVDWGPTTPSLEVDLTAGLVLALGRVTAAGRPYTTWIEMRTVTP